MNPNMDDYSDAISREKTDAHKFDNELEAGMAISNLLLAWDYGHDPSTDYSYVGYIEDDELNESWLCAEA